MLDPNLSRVTRVVVPLLLLMYFRIAPRFTGFLAVEKSKSLHKPGIEPSTCSHVLETLSKPLPRISRSAK